MKRIIRIGLSAVAVLLVLALAAYPSGASEVPRAVISCDGCINMEQTAPDAYKAIVSAEKNIKLRGDPGYSRYNWFKNGSLFASGQENIAREISDKITESAQYSLKVTDVYGRSDIRTIVIVLASGEPKNICAPDLAEIEAESKTLVVGQKIKVKTDYDERRCPGAVFSWTVDEGASSGLFIENPKVKETYIIVISKPSAGKNPVLRARVENNGISNQKSLMLTIVDNTPPTIKNRYFYSTPLSNKEFKVNCAPCQTGNGFNEASDYISEFSAELLDENQKIIDSGKVTASRGQALSEITLTPSAEGKYFLRVTAKDSYGLSSAVMEDIFVGFGNTDKDTPFIIVSDVIYGFAGSPVPIDASKTNTHGLGVSVHFEDVIDIANSARSKAEPLFNIYGNPCRSLNCTTVFKYHGKYLIKITMAYIRNGKASERQSVKLVTVIVREPATTSISAPAPRPAPSESVSVAETVLPQTPKSTIAPMIKLTPQPDIQAKPSSGLSPVAVFAAFIAMALRKKI